MDGGIQTPTVKSNLPITDLSDLSPTVISKVGEMEELILDIIYV